MSTLHCIGNLPFSALNCTFYVGGAGMLVAFGVAAMFIVFITQNHSRGVGAVQASSDLRLEGDLHKAIAMSAESQWAPTWTAPRLPASVIASIWTGRFIDDSGQPQTKTQRYASMLGRMTWGYQRAAPYIAAAGFLSLRDAGLITLSIEPEGKFLGSFKRVWLARTDLPFAGLNLGAVESGLLLACLDLAHKRFGKDEQPAAFSVVAEWIHTSQTNPFKWVVAVAVKEGRELGLYEPAIKKRNWYGWLVEGKPVYSVEHLAACEDQAVARAARWHEFETNEKELAQTMLTEVGFGIRARRQSGG